MKRGIRTQPFRTEILPSWVHGLNEFYLFAPSPSLDLLLSEDSPFHLVCHIIINQRMNGISLRETLHETHFVFIDPTLQVIGHTNVESSMDVTHDVNVVGLHTPQATDSSVVPPSE